MGERERVLNVRLTDSEMDMVKELADHVGLSQSDTIRQLVRREHAKMEKGKKSAPRRSTSTRRAGS